MIFLDIDGVLVPFAKFDKKARPAVAAASCVAALNKVISATGATLVVVSDWRKRNPVAALGGCFRRWGVACGEVEKTDDLGPLVSRSGEVEEYLVANWDRISSFVIIEDHHMMGDLEPRTVRPDPLVGLSDADADAAVTMLARPKEKAWRT